jgi:hypothetical protein
MAHIPDGVFEFTDDSIKILSAPERTIEELTRLAELLRAAQESPETRENLAETIKDELPSMSPLALLLPRNAGELYAFIAVLLAAVQIYIALQVAPPAQPPIQVTVNQVIEQTLVTTTVPPKPTTQAAKAKKTKVGRNERCPCGSGKKYKRCCINAQ